VFTKSNRYLQLVAGSNVNITESLHILGVTLDSTISLDKHVNNMVKTCNFHLQALCQVRQSITRNVANVMACVIIGTRPDYCNSMFYGMSRKNFDKLHSVQHCAALCGVGRRQQSARQLRHTLHRLPVSSKNRLQFGNIELQVTDDGST